MQGEFSVTKQTKDKIPRLPYLALKDDILGKKYSLSMAFVGKAKSKEINKKYRKKDKATNVLSFLLSKTEGELVLCPSVIKREAKDKDKNFGKNFRELLGFLVIHGMLHLKGMSHSSRMEVQETKYDKKYFYRNRRGVHHDQNSGGRISKRRKRS